MEKICKQILIRSRIDQILSSDSVNHYFISSAIVPFIWSDHDLVSSSIDFSEVTRGKGIWLFNHELLNNDVYRKDIITCIDAMKCIPTVDDDIFTWYENLKKCFKDISKRHSKSINVHILKIGGISSTCSKCGLRSSGTRISHSMHPNI